jgi:hypothetical protein
MRLRGDQRGQSMTYLKVAGTLILFSGMYTILSPAVTEMQTAAADVRVRQESATAATYVGEMWTWLPLAAMGLLVFWLISRSIFASGR